MLDPTYPAVESSLRCLIGQINYEEKGKKVNKKFKKPGIRMLNGISSSKKYLIRELVN